MPTMFATAEAVRRFERAANQGRLNEAKDLRAEIATQAADLAATLQWLKEVGVDHDVIREAAGALHDAIVNADAVQCHTIDDCGEWYDAADFSALHELVRQ